MKWVIIAIALFQGAWLAFDGSRALVTGDYVTRDGRLGPWSRMVAAIGIDPRGGLMKCTHVALGAAWLVAAIVFFVRPQAGQRVVLVCAIATLWYLPIGTVLSAVQIVLLLLPRAREIL